MQPQFHESGTMIAFLQCMIIHSDGGTYDNTIKAIPMEQPSQGSTYEVNPSITSHELGGTKEIECYVKKDVTKELCFSLHDTPNAQKSKHYYLECIENLFKKCTRSGGGMQSHMVYIRSYS